MTTMQDKTPQAPVAKRLTQTTELHGVKLTDDYAWLRMADVDQPDSEVIAHLKAENAYADAMMAHTQALQLKLFQEFEARPDEFLNSAPVQEGRFDYFERRAAGSQYKTYWRRRRQVGAPDEVLLDLNELAQGHAFVDLGQFVVSDSGNFVAYTIDTSGSGQYTLYVKNLITGTTGAALAQRVTGVVFAADNRTMFYTTQDEKTKRSNKLFRLVRGRRHAHFLFEENDELFSLGVSRTRTGRFILAGSVSYGSCEYRYVSAERPTERLKVFARRQKGLRYSVSDWGNWFFIRTNNEAQNFRLMRTPLSRPSKANWKEIVPHRQQVLLEEVVFFRRHMVIFEREDGLAKVRVVNMSTGKEHYIDFPEPIYSIGSLEDNEMFFALNREFNSKTLRLRYDSFTTPPTVFDFDMDDGGLSTVEKLVVPGHDPSQYHSQRIYATASDGTPVPVLLAWKGELAKDGQRPVYLYGYGAYGMCALWAGQFRMSRLSLLDRGVIFACALIRGGGELGEPWYDGGKMLNKRNTFTDFIACADHLVDQGYASRERLVIEGRSAGGLTMGAVLNIRPHLCKAALLGVPFVDVINTMLDTSVPLTVGEFLEWGNPRDEQYFHYMLSYSPYDNIEAKPYPAIFLYSALHDSAVPYWEPAKYTAKLRALKTDNNPLIFKTLLAGGGHTGLSARADQLKQEAFRFAFILDQLGIGQ